MTELIDPCGVVHLSNGCTPLSDHCCLPSRCFYCEAHPRNVPHCLPKVTHSSAIMRYTQHREASVSSFPSHGESLLSPFSMRRIRDISSLTPGIQFCETRWERFCRGSEVESGIFHCAGFSCHLLGSEECGDGVCLCGGKYSRRDFLALPNQCEKQRPEPKSLCQSRPT